ncbi:MAG: hypothetical protein JWM86_2386 [Thermoleophilia bacterium]|nr:hypothetical protein [Thermoleophilia bacterium]
MAAKKARKREYIPPSSEVVNRRERTHQTVRTQRPAASARGGSARQVAPYPEPSLKRTLKRLPIYFVMIFALQYYLLGSGSKTLEGSERLLFAAGQAGLVTLIFAPFMHVMDRFAYNRYLKRTGKAPAPKG